MSIVLERMMQAVAAAEGKKIPGVKVKRKGNTIHVDFTKVKLTCCVCKKQYEDAPPKMCCNGHECGCMGLPIEPTLCPDCSIEKPTA